MTELRALTCSLVMLMLTVKTASPHHAFSPVYDASKMMTVVGVVTQFNFVNPHATLLMDVTDDAGKVVKWTVEFAGRLNLSEVGWTAGSVKAKRTRHRDWQPDTHRFAANGFLEARAF